jgi:hypothetical protein
VKEKVSKSHILNLYEIFTMGKSIDLQSRFSEDKRKGHGEGLLMYMGLILGGDKMFCTPIVPVVA